MSDKKGTEPSVVVLSPHFDDAVLDCWYPLTQPGTILINIFAAAPPEGTRTFWDRLCGEADSPKMVQERIRENELAVAMSGSNVRQLYLDFMDSQYRSGNPTPAELADAIQAAAPSGVYFAPLAISRVFRHADHVLARQTGLELLKRGCQVGFYPDVPYMNPPRRYNAGSLRRLQARAEKALGRPLTLQVRDLSTKQLAAKRAAMHAYKSQYTMTNAESFGGLDRTGRRPYELIFMANPKNLS